MTTPVPPTEQGTARRGQRIAGLTPADLAVAPAPVNIGNDGQTAIDPTRAGALLPESPLAYAGDIISASTTLAVDLNTGGISYFRYEHRTIVQPGETETDAYARLAETTNTGVIDLIDDVEDRLAEHEQSRAQRAARLGQTN